MKRTFSIFICCLTLLAATNQSEAGPRRQRIAYDANSSVTFLPHPSGCPRIAFCGCGAANRLGISDRRLWRADNWPRYYRGSTMIAVWHRHVAVIDYMTGPHTAMLYDYNSGGHRSRHWERDLRGAKIIGGNAHASIGFANAY